MKIFLPSRALASGRNGVGRIVRLWFATRSNRPFHNLSALRWHEYNPATQNRLTKAAPPKTIPAIARPSAGIFMRLAANFSATPRCPAKMPANGINPQPQSKTANTETRPRLATRRRLCRALGKIPPDCNRPTPVPRHAFLVRGRCGLSSTADKNLQLRAGFRWNGYDVSVFADNVLDQHPELFKSRDIADDTPTGCTSAAVSGRAATG